MTTPVNCPNCGSQLPPGAASCARCGVRFDMEPDPTASAPEPPVPAPATARRPVPQAPRPSASGGPEAVSLQAYLTQMRERWGLDATAYFTATLILAGLAIVLGSIAHAVLLTAGENDFDKQSDFSVWLTTANALALASLVTAVLVRNNARSDPVETDVRSLDFRIALGLAALTIIFALIGVILGMDGRGTASGSWERYASLFAFVEATWLALSKPVPALVGSVKAETVGMIAGVVAIVMLLVGQIQGLSNDVDSFFGGIAWQAMAVSILLLDLGWFLGMRRERD
jgi:hypothetical protein